MRHSLEQDDTCYFLNDLDITIFDAMQETMQNDPLELCLVQAKEERDNDPILVKQITYLEANEFMIWRRKLKELKNID